MIRTLILSLLFIWLMLPLKAGDSLDINRVLFRDFKPLQDRARLELKFEASMNSTGLPSAIPNAFIVRKFIDKDLIAKSSAKLKDRNNIVGGILSSGVDFQWIPNESWRNSGAYAGLSYEFNQYLSLRFPKSLFDMVMQGNAPFAGTTVPFDKTNVYSMQYQSIKIHYFKKKANSLFHAAIGLAKGNSVNQIQIEKASLFTEISGSYIDIALRGKVFTSTSSDNQIRTGIPSAGPVADFGYRFQKNRFIFDISVNNLGFINWGASSKTYSRDTSIHYAGIEVHDIFHVNQQQSYGDSLQERLIGKALPGKEMLLIPAQFRATAIWQFSPSSGFQVSVTQLMMPEFKPQKTLAYLFEKTCRKQNKIGFQVGLSHGGLGKWNSFLRIIPIHTSRHSLLIGTSANEGWLNPGSWKGNGLVFSYQWYL